MGTSRRDKTARRAALHEASIRRRLATGDHRGALHEAMGWLLGEAAKVGRNRPEDAAAVNAAVAEQLVRLAVSVPSYTPAKEARHAAS